MCSRTIAHRFYVMDTEAFDFVLGTDLFVQHSQIQPLTLQAPYLLYVDHSSGRESVPPGAVGTYPELPEAIEGGALEHDGGLQN